MRLILAALLLSASLHAYERAGWVAVMPPGTHGTQGLATIVDARTVKLEHVSYDGTGARVFFYAGPENSYLSFVDSGFAISAEFTTTVYSDATLELTLPEGRTLDGMTAIGIVCTLCQKVYCAGVFMAPKTGAAAVIGSGSDSDGDGFSDALEIGAGTFPNNPLSTPLLGQPAPTPAELRLQALKINLNFAQVTRDSLAVTFELPVPGNTLGLKLIVQIGDAVYPITLTEKSCACTNETKIKFSGPGKDGWRKVSLKISKSSLQAGLAAAGLANQDLNTQLQFPVTVLFNGAAYQKPATVKYTARRDRRGVAR